jgi:hypothetical protein
MQIIRTTDETAQLKDENGHEISPLQGEILVELAPRRCERSYSEEEGRSIPSNLGNAMELVRDLGDGGRHDGLYEKDQHLCRRRRKECGKTRTYHIQRHHENREHQRKKDEEKLKSLRVVVWREGVLW